MEVSAFVILYAPFLVKGAVTALGGAVTKKSLEAGSKKLDDKKREQEQLDGLHSTLARGVTRAVWNSLDDEYDTDPGDDFWDEYQTDSWWQRFNDQLLTPLSDAGAWDTYVQSVMSQDAKEAGDLVLKLLRDKGTDPHWVGDQLGIKVDGFLFWLGPSLIHELRTKAAEDAQTTPELIAGLRDNYPDTGRLSPGLLRREVRSYLQAVKQDLRNSLTSPFANDSADLGPRQQAVSVRLAVRQDLAHQSEGPEIYAPLASRAHDEDMSLIQWEDLALQNEHLAVLADPGLGKTRLLHAHAGKLAQDALDRLDEGVHPDDLHIPILVRCDEIHSAAHERLEDACVAAQRLGAGVRGHDYDAFSDWLIRHLKTTRNTFLLDALDEIPSTSGALPLGRMLRKWAGSGRIILSSRITGYRRPQGISLNEVELQPFSPAEVHSYVRACRLNTGARARLKQQLEKPSFMGLARIPLLLTFICSIASKADSLPRSRKELYERILEHLLSDTHRLRERPAYTNQVALGDNEKDEIRRVLSLIALSFADTPAGWIDRMPAAELRKAANDAAPKIADVVDSCAKVGILVLAGVDPVSAPAYFFLHRTFAEHLVAQAVAEQTTDWRALVDKHLADDEWQHVLPLVAANMANPSPYLEHLLSRDQEPQQRGLYLAARAISELSDRQAFLVQTQTEATSTRLLEQLTGDNAEAANSLISAARRLPDTAASHVKELLKHQDARLRVTALEVLAARDDENSFRAVTEVLGDTGQEHEIKMAAVEALARRDGQRIVDVLMNVLRNENQGRLRRFAAGALATHGGQDAIDALIGLLTAKDQNPQAQLAVVHALSFRSTPDTIKAIISVVRDNDRDPELRKAAVSALSLQRYNQDAAEVLIQILTDGNQDPALRETTAETLRLYEGQTTDILINIVTDNGQSWKIRRAAAQSLGNHSSPAATEALIGTFMDNSQNEDLRRAAGQSLGSHRKPDATEVLIATLIDNTKSGDLRHTAAWSLSGHGSQGAIQVLVNVLTDNNQDEELRKIAARSLGELAHDRWAIEIGSPGEYTYHRWPPAGSPSEQDRYNSVTEVLINVLSDKAENLFVRLAATESVARISDPRVTEILISILSDATQMPELRVEAATFLPFHSDKGANALVEAITAKDQDPRIRKAAADSLGLLDLQDALIGIVKDQHQDVGARESAAKALAEYPSIDSRDALMGVLLIEGEDPGLRRVFAEALARGANAKPTGYVGGP